MPHPRRWRSAMLADVRQSARSSHIWNFQRPWLPERALTADDAALVGRMIRDWSGPRLPDDDALMVYRRAMSIPSTAHCSIEPYRWMVRSMARPDGLQFNRRMKMPVRVPTLHLHGSLDPVMRTRSAAGFRRVRRGAVPLAALRRPGALPARGGPGGVLHGADQLAEGPGTGPVTNRRPGAGQSTTTPPGRTVEPTARTGSSTPPRTAQRAFRTARRSGRTANSNARMTNSHLPGA